MSSNTFELGRLPPKSAPKVPPLELGLAPSLLPPVLGEVDLRWGEKASFSLPTGDALLLMLGVTSMVLACLGVRASSADVAESARAISVGAVESTVSDAIRGEDSVK